MTSIKKQTFEKVDVGNILKDVADEQLLSPTFFKKGDEWKQKLATKEY